MISKMKTDSGWSLESALDTEWSHAIAPKAKILIVESENDSGSALLKAVDYATSKSDVVAISMSWGGDEFKSEASLDKHFIGKNGVAFFASSGDSGAGVSWPAVSSKVISVGGTSLSLDQSGKLISEKAWVGSGGGVSQYESQSTYQTAYNIPKSNDMRAVPDVSYAADPLHGFSVYHSNNNSKSSLGWYVVGGTSAGAPQWAAIASLGFGVKDSLNLTKLYVDKADLNNEKFFRDIISGKNGTCAYYCSARKRYDYVTGLGSPLTYKF
jgi:subtilase family serine protease